MTYRLLIAITDPLVILTCSIQPRSQHHGLQLAESRLLHHFRYSFRDMVQICNDEVSSRPCPEPCPGRSRRQVKVRQEILSFETTVGAS